ncbi:methionyl-trna formyltransferase [hydrocarbon metagenome]|uniref:methionyl-tRNA formyltransferase n=1 Tax=hydrocarbon metagenome TaxID=938273 RepID=A0A0W8E561_9ZZZZ
MRVVFMGTSIFAVPSLLKLYHSSYHQIVGVVSQPDKARGRGKKLSTTPVKETALHLGLEIYQTNNIKSDEALAKIREWHPEIIIVASYGQIIPESILEYPTYGCINVHASILPEYRGAAPIQRALMAGEDSTGITIMYMDKGLDTGDILAQYELPIRDEMDHGTLENILAEIGAELLIQVIKEIEQGSASRMKQDDSRATYAHMLKPEDEVINWSEPSGAIFNQIRALSPSPGSYTWLDDRKIKIFAARIIDESTDGEIGQVVRLSSEGFVVKTGDKLLEILEVQKEGKNRIKAVDFLRGYKGISGRILGR